MDPIKEALTFDDVTMAPKYSEVLPSEVDTSTKLSPNLTLKIPLLSSAMDTVTESKMAIAIAKSGGIGVIHRNLDIKKQIEEIKKVKKGVKNNKTKIISDGGIKYSGDIAKALAAGADAVMIGSLFAGAKETPGKLIKKNGKLYKSFRGMGSVGAMNKGSADRYFQKKQKDTSKYVPEGVEGYVKFKGEVGDIIYKLIGGLRSSMGYLGAKKVINLKIKPNFVKITKAGFYESMVHNVDEIKKNSKY